MFCLIDSFLKSGTLDFAKRIGYVKKQYPLGEAGLTNIFNPDITDGEPEGNAVRASYC